MMNSMSSMSVANVVFDQRQFEQPTQTKVNEKKVEEELRSEERPQQVDVYTPRIVIGRASTDIRLYQIHQAANAGLLRPVWPESLETLHIDPDMPRMRDIISRVTKNRDEEADRAAEKTERSADADRAAESEQAAKVERAERAVEAEQAAAERAVVAEHVVSSAESE